MKYSFLLVLGFAVLSVAPPMAIASECARLLSSFEMGDLAYPITAYPKMKQGRIVEIKSDSGKIVLKDGFGRTSTYSSAELASALTDNIAGFEIGERVYPTSHAPFLRIGRVVAVNSTRNIIVVQNNNGDYGYFHPRDLAKSSSYELSGFRIKDLVYPTSFHPDIFQGRVVAINQATNEIVVQNSNGDYGYFHPRDLANSRSEELSGFRIQDLVYPTLFHPDISQGRVVAINQVTNAILVQNFFGDIGNFKPDDLANSRASDLDGFKIGDKVSATSYQPKVKSGKIIGINRFSHTFVVLSNFGDMSDLHTKELVHGMSP